MIPDSAWLPGVGRTLGGPVRVVSRLGLGGGYASPGVERIDLDVGGQRVAVVLKSATTVEVAASRAVAVVGGVPRHLGVGTDWLVTPFADGSPLAAGEAVPDEVWEVLARVHAHWWRKRPRGIPVVDGPWWARLCDRTLVAVHGGADRTGAPAFARAAQAVTAWRTDPRILAALAVLPRTLVHGDPHRGNILVGTQGAVLIDWGNARIAPAALDLAVLRAQGATVPAAYDGPGASDPVAREWADVHVNVAYLGFAADHLGAARVGEMVAAATRALDALGRALARLPTTP